MAMFRVPAVHRYLKDHSRCRPFTAPRQTRNCALITCGGAFDSATGHYLGNIVVYATEAG